jgi:hypothetical protein
MRIEKTSDGRFIRVLDPAMQGLIGRVYQEIDQRKMDYMNHEDTMMALDHAVELLDSQIQTLVIHYSEVSAALEKLLPVGSELAFIDRTLLVDGYVRALQFISTTVSEPALIIANTIMIDRLNVDMIHGKTLADLDNRFAPMVHIHAPVTQSVDGFMSKTDKTKLDGISVQNTAPAIPQLNHIWIDMSS